MRHVFNRLAARVRQKMALRLLPVFFGVFVLLHCPDLSAQWLEKDLDEAVESLVKELVEQGDLKNKPVIVSPYDLFESSTGLGSPLTNQLRGKIVSELKRRGARVLLPGSDEDANMILQGTWQRQGEDLALDFKVMKLTSQGPEAVAAASEKTPLSGIDPGALKKDRESYARLMVRKLEAKVSERKRGRKIYMEKFVVDAKDKDSSGLSAYLSDMFRNAMAESQLFAPLDEKKALRGLSSETLRQRGTRGISAKHQKKTETANLVAVLADAQGVLKGKAWRQGSTVAANVEIYDMDDTMITAASVDIPNEIFPERMINPPQAPILESISSTPQTVGAANISKGGLSAQIATDHGENEPLYRKGEHIRFIVRINQDAWVYLFDINPQNEVVLLYPVDENGELAHDRECGSRLQSGSPLVLPGDGCSYDLVADEPYGKDAVWAVASRTPLNLTGISENDWSNAEIFQQKIRMQGLSGNEGYAEAMLEMVTAP